MKILYYFRDYASYMYQWQHFQLIDELNHYGIEIEIYTGIVHDRCDGIEDFSSYLRIHHDFDLFMTSHGSDIISKEHILLVSEYSIPTLLICFDNLHAPYMHLEIAKYFDLVWLTSKETDYLFRNNDCKNIIFQTYASNPFAFKPTRSSQLSHSITFIGTPYGSRINKINTLLSANIDVRLFYTKKSYISASKTINYHPCSIESIGSKMKTVLQYVSNPIGRSLIKAAIVNKLKKSSVLLEDSDNLYWFDSLTFEDMVKEYSGSSLALNITELRNTYVLKRPIYKIHLRTFEIPMCCGLEICSYTDELSTYFEDGKEIVLYRNDEEFIEKAKYYISPNRDEEVQRMKINARKRSVRDHTWYDRFSSVFNFFNFKIPAKIILNI